MSDFALIESPGGYEMSMEQKIAIIADSITDMTDELGERYGIHILPLKVVYPNDTFTDGVDITPQDVYARFPWEIPSTSALNLREAQQLIHELRDEGYTHIIAVCASTKISGTCSIVSAALGEEEDLPSYTMDTKCIAMGSGLAAIWAAEQRNAGASFEEIVEKLSGMVPHCASYFYMDSLDYLRKGGRISAAAAAVGTLLGIKPIITCNAEGAYIVAAKPRGVQNSIKKLLELARERAGDRPAWICLQSGNGDPKQMDLVRTTIQERMPKAKIILEKQINASLAVHTGPGLIGIAMLTDVT